MANPYSAADAPSPLDGGSQLSLPGSRRQSESILPTGDSRPPSSNSTPKYATLAPAQITLDLPNRHGQRSTPTSARGKHTHNPYGAAVLVPSPLPVPPTVDRLSPEDTGSSVTSDREQSQSNLTLSLHAEMWPVGPWTCFFRPMLGRLKFVSYPGQSQLASIIPTEDELLRNVKHQLHQRPDLSHPAKAREGNLAEEVNKQASELVNRRWQVRIFVGNLWTDLPVGFCQWLLEELHSQLAPPSEPSERDPQRREPWSPPRAPYLVNASYHQTGGGRFKGCFHATLCCDADPTLILRHLHHRVLLDRCGYWFAQSAGEMEMLKDYTTDVLEEQKRLKASGTTTTFWTLPRSPMSWELVVNQEASGTIPANEIQQMKRTRRCLPLPPSIPCAILPKEESSYDRFLPSREEFQS